MTAPAARQAGHGAHARCAIRASSSARPSLSFLALDRGCSRRCSAPSIPAEINPAFRNKKPGVERMIRADDGTETRSSHRFGTDTLGRDVYSRVVYGARVSLIIGVTVAVHQRRRRPHHRPDRRLHPLARRHHHAHHGRPDGDSGDPAGHGRRLAVARRACWPSSSPSSSPRSRAWCAWCASIVLSIREEPYVEAAITVGTPTPTLLVRHVLPNTVAPLIVQGTFICALGHPDRGDPVASSASASRRRRRPGATSWPRGARCSASIPHNIFYPGHLPGARPCWPSTCWATACATRSIPASPNGCEAHGR